MKQRIWLVPQKQQYCNNTTWVWLLLSWGQLFRFDLSLMLLIAWSRCPPFGYVFKTLLNMTRLGTPKCKNMASRCFLLSSTNKQIVFLVIWPGTAKQGHTCAGKVNLIQLLICPVPYMSITREGALLISILHVLAMSFRDTFPNQVSLRKVLLNNVLHSLHSLHSWHSWERHVAPLRVSPAHI